jgi:hypothetical protein
MVRKMDRLQLQRAGFWERMVRGIDLCPSLSENNRIVLSELKDSFMWGRVTMH